MLCCSEFDDTRLSMWGLAPTPRPDSARLSKPCATGISLRVQSARGSQRIFFGITGVERPGPPYPAGSRSPDLWFQHFAIVVSDMDAAHARLRAAGVPPISFGGPETLPEQNGGLRAFKLRDPDGHPLELLWFPPGQGRANLAAAGRLVFGHRPSAIAIASTKKSLAFYRGLPGLHTAFAGTNEGETQERLDGVAGAVVRITGLQAAPPEGSGIEFLEYEKPAVGRPAAGIRADDAAHAHLTLVVVSLQEILAAPEVQRLSASAIPLSRKVCSASIVDPDGDVLVLAEKTLPPSSSRAEQR